MISNFHGKYAFLSNFWSVPVRYEGLRYPTLEHAYQAAKTLDRDNRLAIASIPAWEAAKAKKAGRKLAMRPDWDTVKVSIMRELIKEKFHPHTELSQMLLDTGDQELVEGNWWGDTFWGICHGTGENWLGKLLMERRSELKLLSTVSLLVTTLLPFVS